MAGGSATGACTAVSGRERRSIILRCGILTGMGYRRDPLSVHFDGYVRVIMIRAVRAAAN